jgi:four helix bundle protein
MNIARKEVRETRYWLRLIKSSVFDSAETTALTQEGDELVRILSIIVAMSCQNAQN